MKPILRWAAVAWVCGFVTAAAAAEAPPVTAVPEVVVTATRTRTLVEDLATSVTVVYADDVERQGVDSTADALRGTPGLDITEFGSTGHSAFASIRGAAPDQVLVLLDGIEVNSPTVGQFDFANLTTDNIDRIEIVRGGGGALYGSEAIGGVVNVISRRAQGPLHVMASGEAGSAATHREVLAASGARGPFAVSGAASFLASDGFRSINDDYRNFSTAWRADADVLPGATARTFLRYTNARTGLANFNVADGVLDPDAHSRSDFFLAKGEWEHALTGALTYRASASMVRDNQRFRDDETEAGATEPIVMAHVPSEIITAETQWDYLWRQFALSTVGLEFKERSARIFRFTRSDEEEADEAEELERFKVQRVNPNRSSIAGYAQEQLRAFDDTLHAVGGLRYDRIDRFGDEITWSGSGSYLLSPTRTRLRIGYAEGFRAPTFDELFETNLGSPTVGNPRLRPERSWEINAGFTQEILDGRVRFEPTYFYRNVTNLIEEVADQLPGPIAVPEEDEMQAPLARNLNARFQGIEVIARAQPARWLTLASNYTYVNFDTPTGVLLNRPRHRGAVFASVERASLLQAGDSATLSVRVQAVGHRDSPDPRADFTAKDIGGYARTDLSLSYRFTGRLTPLIITLTVRNLFNRDYAESIGFPAPPSRFLIGLRCDLPPLPSAL